MRDLAAIMQDVIDEIDRSAPMATAPIEYESAAHELVGEPTDQLLRVMGAIQATQTELVATKNRMLMQMYMGASTDEVHQLTHELTVKIAVLDALGQALAREIVGYEKCVVGPAQLGDRVVLAALKHQNAEEQEAPRTPPNVIIQ